MTGKNGLENDRNEDAGEQRHTTARPAEEKRREQEAQRERAETSRGNFVSTNQKHYQDLGSDASSVWNFCACYSDVVLRGLK